MRGPVIVALVVSLILTPLGWARPALAQSEPQVETAAPMAPVDNRLLVVGLGMIFGVFAYNYGAAAVGPMLPALGRVAINLQGVGAGLLRGVGSAAVSLGTPGAVGRAAAAAAAIPLPAPAVVAAPVAGAAAAAAVAAPGLTAPATTFFRSSLAAVASAGGGAIVAKYLHDIFAWMSGGSGS
ncbi:MAG: hypothetical protein GC191_10240 [Azospirillum sp.]|nr:hypothetical protein [Azospirillum sp.]